MNILGFGAVCVAVAFALAYELRFSEATLRMGRLLAGADDGRGYQDAVTPPNSTTVGLGIYGAVIAAVVAGYVLFGVWIGLGSLAVIFLMSGVAKAFLPAPDSEHFERRILGSMSRRYADFVKSGDIARAHAMGELLRRAGVPTELLPPNLDPRV